LDANFPAGRNYYWKSEDLPPLSDAAIDTIVAHAENITSPYSAVGLFQLGGAAGRVPEDACAYSHRNARHALNISASWTDGDSDKHIAWARDFDTAMQPYTVGVYVNFLSNEGQDRVKAAYGPRKYDRLVALKRKYDPTNFFRVNQNIQP
jgi:FAD/FMN-containing dehydrogenase